MFFGSIYLKLSRNCQFDNLELEADDDITESKLKRKVTRAKLIHRHTLILYDQQIKEFSKQTIPQLFDRALIVKLISRNDCNGPFYKNINCRYIPMVVYTYPEIYSNGQSSSVDCADLFIPDFTRARPYYHCNVLPRDEEFMLTLTDQNGKRSFAYCIKHFLQEDELSQDKVRGLLPEVFALVSPIHASTFYTALARECVKHLRKGLDILKKLLDAIFNRRFPSNDGVLRVTQTEGNLLKREITIRGEGSILGHTNCSFIVSRFGVEITVSLIGALLAEQRILIGGDSVMQSLVSLIQPFSWPYTLVPVLPDSLLELTSSPTPYILGILRNNLHKLKDLIVGEMDIDVGDCIKEGVLIVDLDGGILVPQPSRLYVASKNHDYKAKCAIDLCQKLLIPKKLVLTLISLFKEALENGPNSVADDRLQRAMLTWFASLIGHYKSCGYYSAYMADINGNSELFHTSKRLLVSAHSSKSAKSFTEWFVETGIFRDWLRRRVTTSLDSTDNKIMNSEDAANQHFDEISLTVAPQLSQKRFRNIFSRSRFGIFRSFF
ncbi:unnamed protein product [Dracunculus medinensis]|uniref:UDENN domain-containing protein n=1 Tax=Dracunculus medinensis TaxID=318479 RepID=A0A158Q5B6_DRAME|nr:unnamed protein product [Dracunculus medinensis]